MALLIADLVMCYNIINGNNCLNSQTFFILNYSAITRGHPCTSLMVELTLASRLSVGHPLRISVPSATLNVRQHFYASHVTPIWKPLPTEIVTAPCIQILPAHPPYNRTNNHPIPLLQYHWCWQLQKGHPCFPSVHKASFQCIRPCRSIFLHPQIHSRHPCPN